METANNYQFKTQNNAIIKLINKCNDINALKYVHSLWKRELIQSTKTSIDISVQTAFIKAFGIHSDIHTVWDIFNSLNNDNIDSVCVNTILQALISNNCNEHAIALYNKHTILMDNISHNLIITAHNKCENNKLLLPNNIMSCDDIRIQTNLIEYYGNSNDIKSALNIYESIHTKDIACVCAMMKAYLNNGKSERVLSLYNEMNSELKKDNICHLLAIKACTNMRNQHFFDEYIDININYENENNKICNALIEMYSVFGNIEKSQNMYYKLMDSKNGINKKQKNISANVLMKAYLNNKLYSNVLSLYDSMDKECKDNISHIYAIDACKHSLVYKKGVNIH